MRSFIVIARKPQATIPAHVEHYLQRADVAELDFAVEDHVFWRSDPGNVLFAGWRGRLQMPSMGTPWYGNESGMTAFAGSPWPKGGMWRADTPWAEQLHKYRLLRPADPTVQDLDGFWSTVSLTRSGTGTLTTDPLSVSMLYRAETKDFVAYSSRAGLAARVAAPPEEEPRRDARGVCWLAYLGYLVGGATGYENTDVLPTGASVDIHPAWGSRARITNAPPWVGQFADGVSDDALIELVHDDLLRSIRSTGLLPTSHHFADITGGKDSRLVLALMLEAGIAGDFRFRTIGAPNSAEAIVGKQIAETFALDHEAVVPDPMQPDDFTRRVGTHVFQTSGMFSSWDLKGGLGVSTQPRVSGFGGEILRTFFGHFPRVSTAQRAREELAKPCDRLGLLRPDVRAEFDAALDREFLDQTDSGGCTPQDLLDAFYIKARVRRWFGTGEELGGAFRVFPLYSLRGVQAAFNLGPDRRRDQLLHFETMRRACDKLARVPFANATWPEHTVAQSPDPAGYGTPAQQSIGDGNVEWQTSRLEQHRAVFKAHLLDDPSNPVFDLVKRDAVQEALTGPTVTDGMAVRQLYGLLTAAIWLGHHEKQARAGAQ